MANSSSGRKMPFHGRNMGSIPILAIILVLIIQCVGKAYAEPDWEALAQAVYLAEGGAKATHPYGIMQKYKKTTPKQACINTLRHYWRDWQAIKGPKQPFLAYAGSRYCPTTGKHLRPAERRLNGYWIGNVTKLYNKGGLEP